jgi:hypothetical protein
MGPKMVTKCPRTSNTMPPNTSFNQFLLINETLRPINAYIHLKGNFRKFVSLKI